MFMTNFSEELTVRFGVLELLRGEWRRYDGTLDPNETTDINNDDDTAFDVLAVNILENADKSPINYVLPPGVLREQLFNQNTVINQNEQSLALRVSKKSASNPGPGGLEPEDSRAVFKNVELDFRQFKKIRMFLHAEQLPAVNSGPIAIPENGALQDDEMIAFIRFGNDFTSNFYQIEVPLKVTPYGTNQTSEQVWPIENEMELALDLLTKLKILSINGTAPPVDALGISFIDEVDLDPSAANKESVSI
jgi:cell surface protein SprA